MRKYKVALNNGQIEEVEGRKITIYIGNIAYEFIIHRHLDYCMIDQLTHKDSGMGIATLRQYMPAALGDKKGAAKLAIEALIEKHGVDYVRTILDNAPKLEAKP